MAFRRANRNSLKTKGSLLRTNVDILVNHEEMPDFYDTLYIHKIYINIALCIANNSKLICSWHDNFHLQRAICRQT